MGFRRVDLDQPFDVVNSFTGSGSDQTTEAASITTVSRSMLVFSAHIGARSTAQGALSGSSPWSLASSGSYADGTDGVSFEVYCSNMRDEGAQAALTLTRTDAAESHGALIALRRDRKLIVARPASASQNDLMVASIALQGVGAPTVTPPAGWTLVRRVAGADDALEVHTKVVSASEPATYTWTFEAKSGAALGMQVFAGVDSANPIDVEAGQSTNGLTHATPSVTTTVGNTMLVTSHAYMSADTWTPPAGMTETIDVSTYPGPVDWGLSLEMNYATQGTAGASGAKTATVANNADNGYTHILALRPAAPVAGQQLHFVHVDHLNTPRLVANAAGTTVWRWDQQEPFGVNVADENPSGLGAFEFPLRFPGQYADKETNLFYNYFRDYDPGIGRYVQSDPIGLEGGVNLYAYANNDPLQFADPLGLAVCIGTWLRQGWEVDKPGWFAFGDKPTGCTCYWTCATCDRSPYFNDTTRGTLRRDPRSRDNNCRCEKPGPEVSCECPTRRG